MKTSIAGVSLVALTLMTPGASISAAPRADGGDAARAIVFVDGAGSTSEIYVRSGDGTRQRVTQNRSQESFPAWSPDRRRIAFVRDGAIWVIGWSMVALALLSRLPVAWVGAFGIAMIAGHNLLDGYVQQLVPTLGDGLGAALWRIVYVGFWAGPVSGGADGPNLMVLYSLVPWVGVMAAG